MNFTDFGTHIFRILTAPPLASRSILAAA